MKLVFIAKLSLGAEPFQSRSIKRHFYRSETATLFGQEFVPRFAKWFEQRSRMPNEGEILGAER